MFAGILILKYILVSLLISIIFGLTLLSHKAIIKLNRYDFLTPYFFQLWSLLIFIILYFYYEPKIKIFEVTNLATFKNILLIIISVIPTSFIVYLGNPVKPNKKFGLTNFLNGVSMEIPQRLLIQNMFTLLNLDIIIYGSITLPILLNAIIWVQFIIVQEIINGRKVSKKILPEIISSIWFSIWVGILYSISGNILLPMLTHGLERTTAYWLKNHFGKANSNLSDGYSI